MNEAAKMFCIVAGVTAGCGLLLSAAHEATRQRIVSQQLRYVKGPAIRAVLGDADNDPLADRKEVSDSAGTVLLFLGKTKGKLTGVAFETSAPGYGGPVRVMTGFDPATGTCKAIAIAGASETPGIGSRIADTAFTRRFRGLSCTTRASLRAGGGTIDGIGGATVSSKAVCGAVGKAQRRFMRLRGKVGEVDK